MEYIEKEAVFETIAESKEKVEKAFGRIGNGVIGIGPLSRKLIMQPLENLESAIAAIPAADVVPVVRCVNCDNSDVYFDRLLCELWGIHVNETDFCSRGAKMEES